MHANCIIAHSQAEAGAKSCIDCSYWQLWVLEQLVTAWRKVGAGRTKLEGPGATRKRRCTWQNLYIPEKIGQSSPTLNLFMSLRS